MVDPVVILVAPVGRGRFRARVDGHTVVTSSRQPFFAAARILAADGADPLTRIIMRHEGRNDDALTSTIGVAAALSVDESGGGPRFTRWDGERLRGVSPPMSETGRAATTLAEDLENGPALTSPYPGEAGGAAGALAAPDAFHGKRTSAP